MNKIKTHNPYFKESKVEERRRLVMEKD